MLVLLRRMFGNKVAGQCRLQPGLADFAQQCSSAFFCQQGLGAGHGRHAQEQSQERALVLMAGCGFVPGRADIAVKVVNLAQTVFDPEIPANEGRCLVKQLAHRQARVENLRQVGQHRGPHRRHHRHKGFG